MAVYRMSAFISTVAVYVLIFIGGLVRVAGAGLGCPDWPRCFGRWIPPLSLSQLPPDIDPALFNITLAWIEYCNRLFGVTVGLSILITAVLAIVHCRKIPKILYTSIAVLILTAFQGWYGSLVVKSELLPITVSIHMLLAVIIVGMLIYVTQHAYYYENPKSYKGTLYPENIERWVWFLGGSATVQIVIGTQVRSALEVLQQQFPLLSAQEWLDRTGAIQNIHWALGIAMFFISWHIGIKILKFNDRLPMLIKQSIIAIMALISIQLVIGLIIVTAGLLELARLFHLWVGSLYFGMVVMLLIAVRKQKDGKSAV